MLPRLSLPEHLFKFSLLAFLGLFFLIENDALHRLIFYLLVLLPFILRIEREDIRLLFKPEFKILLFFLVFYALSGFWSSVFSIDLQLQLLKKMILTLLFLCVIGYALLRGWQQQMILALVYGATIGIIISLVQRYMLEQHDWQLRFYDIGRGGHPIKTAAMLGSVLIMSVFYHTAGYSLLIRFSQLVLLCGIFLTQSRSVLLAVSIALLVYFWLSRQYRLLTAMLLLILMVTGYIILSGDFGRLLSLDSLRYEIWLAAWHKLQPVWLTGMGAIPEKITFQIGDVMYDHVHSIYLHILLQTGLTGLILWIIFHLSLFYRSLQLSRQQVFIPLIILIYTTVIGLFDFSSLFNSPDIEWLIFWIPFGLVIFSCKKTVKPA